ncbi:MAG TPA: hypothetical protein VF699_12140 [Caulobacteraceae bacterium]|jgi:hypothetical protein
MTTVEQLSNVVETVSGVAAAITLLYLTFQIRQSAKHQRGNMSHSRSAHVQQVMRATAASDGLMETVLRGWAGAPLDRVETNQFYWFVSALLTMFQDTFHQRQVGMVSSLTYDSSVRTMQLQLAQPGVRAVWIIARGGFEPSFAAFVDGLMRRTPMAFTGDVAARWNALAAEELRSAPESGQDLRLEEVERRARPNFSPAPGASKSHPRARVEPTIPVALASRRRAAPLHAL